MNGNRTRSAQVPTASGGGAPQLPPPDRRLTLGQPGHRAVIAPCGRCKNNHRFAGRYRAPPPQRLASQAPEKMPTGRLRGHGSPESAPPAAPTVEAPHGRTLVAVRGHVPEGRQRRLMPGAAERGQTSGDHQRVIDRRRPSLLEPPPQPPRAARRPRTRGSRFAISAVSSSASLRIWLRERLGPSG